MNNRAGGVPTFVVGVPHGRVGLHIELPGGVRALEAKDERIRIAAGEPHKVWHPVVAGLVRGRAEVVVQPQTPPAPHHAGSDT
jgi:hypothetical protein